MISSVFFIAMGVGSYFLIQKPDVRIKLKTRCNSIMSDLKEGWNKAKEEEQNK